MRTYIILLLLSCISSWNVMAQEKIEFDKLIIDNSVSLSIKENPIRPTNDMHIIFIDQKYGTKVLRDFQRLLKDEFPNVGDEEYAYLKECFWQVWFFPDGSYVHRSFEVPKETLEHIPDLEEHLKNLILRLETIRVDTNIMTNLDTRYKNNSIGGLVFPFFYLRKVIKD